MTGPNNEEILDGQDNILGANAEPTVAEPSTPEPSNLADAFKAYREQNASLASSGVPTGEPAVGTSTSAGDMGEGQDTGEPGEYSYSEGMPGSTEQGDMASTGGQGDTGGFAASAPDVDFSSYRKNLIDELGNAAIQTVQQRFAEQGINKITISQLYQRDEDTGSVSFLNPDDPRRPFSSRAEAQAWCNAFNQDYDAEFRKAAVAERDKLVKQYQPTMELINFAPEYNKFDKVKQEVIDDMIEPYAVRDNSGRVIGYNCNLKAVAERADKLIARFQPAQPAQHTQDQQPVNRGTEPALDMKGSGSGSTGEKEPKNLAEALKRVQAEKKKKGKK